MSERRRILTPWDIGAPAPLSIIPILNHRFSWAGWVPSRRQVLCGYRDPETGCDVEGQIPQALAELRDQGAEDPSLDQLARRLALDPGDRDLIAVLFGGDVSPIVDRWGATGAFNARRYHELIAHARGGGRLTLAVLDGTEDVR